MARLEIPEEAFNMEGTPFMANMFNVGKTLKIVEKFLGQFYGEDFANWHEACLDAKKFIIADVLKTECQNPSNDERHDQARRTLIHVLALYEVV